MSSDHHDHHDHHHHHDHQDHHDHPALSDMDKLKHLLGHWQDHNEDHAQNYRNWAEKAEGAGQKDAAELLRQAAEKTDLITDIFRQALKAMA